MRYTTELPGIYFDKGSENGHPWMTPEQLKELEKLARIQEVSTWGEYHGAQPKPRLQQEGNQQEPSDKNEQAI